ncbi:MAG: type II toxin-antitoxin system RatA family toxin [Gammaproteobacteria bacterium]|nr:type II toxin-antitoxin system RatA family toxin [Gammaproteobacteria bacterium]
MMRRVNRSALVPFKAEQMFALVDDVAAYPDFLPWCNSAEVHSRTDDIVEATLELQKGKISKTFTTRNSRQKYSSIDLALVGGPFRHLSGGWRFTDLGNAGSKVSLELEFEFDSRLADMMFGAFFEETCNSLVDAFSNRAAAIFGGD